MPKIIVTSRYMKSDAHSHIGNYMKYIATREGVKENNPHVHIVVYSQNPKEGFLTNVGIEKIRSVFANDIYRDELQNLYQKQTAVRDKLRSESDALMKSLVSELRARNYSDPQLDDLILKLYTQLKNSSGKKQYGYLKPEVKRTVDEIVSCLVENPLIKKMYSEWCELEREKYVTYTSAVKSFPTLAENKVFKPIKNCVINTVLNMNCTLDSPECEIEKDTDKAKEWLEISAAAGNEYAKNLLENMDRYNQSAVRSAAASILNSLGRMIYEDYSRNTHSRYITEHKLQNAIRRKKLALGIKDDRTVEREVKLLENL